MKTQLSAKPFIPKNLPVAAAAAAKTPASTGGGGEGKSEGLPVPIGGDNHY